MSTILLVIHILLAIALVGVILIQRNEGGLGGLGGGGGSMMTGRAAANLLTRSTAIIATLFMVNSVLLAIVAGTERASFLDDEPAVVAPIEATTPAATGGDQPPADGEGAGAPAATE
jgi:preprotein translocase subunit SecG